MNIRQPAQLPTEITVIAYPDRIVEALGFGPDHPYIEACILPVVGPSTTLLWRRLARTVLSAGDTPVTVDVADLIACLGLGDGLAKNSPGARSIARMVNFDLARQAGRNNTLLAIRTALAPHGDHRAQRLPASARTYHDHTTHTTSPRTGRVTVTPAAGAVLARTHTDVDTFVFRHHTGDWGDVTVDEALDNNTVADHDGALLSRYQLDADTVICVTTNPDRTTTVALPGQR